MGHVMAPKSPFHASQRTGGLWRGLLGVSALGPKAGVNTETEWLPSPSMDVVAAGWHYSPAFAPHSFGSLEGDL